MIDSTNSIVYVNMLWLKSSEIYFLSYDSTWLL